MENKRNYVFLFFLFLSLNCFSEETKQDSSKEQLQVQEPQAPPGYQLIKQEKNYTEGHKDEPNGLGFGLGIRSPSGVILFYDKNLENSNQIHFQISSNASSRTNLFGESLIRTSQNLYFVSYRLFMDMHKGYYYGFGGGFFSSSLKYNESSVISASEKYTGKYDGGFVVGEIGWQGIDGYYFHVGFQPAFKIYAVEDFDINKISDTSNHREVAKDEFEALKTLSQISLGFGWFF